MDYKLTPPDTSVEQDRIDTLIEEMRQSLLNGEDAEYWISKEDAELIEFADIVDEVSTHPDFASAIVKIAKDRDSAHLNELLYDEIDNRLADVKYDLLKLIGA